MAWRVAFAGKRGRENMDNNGLISQSVKILKKGSWNLGKEIIIGDITGIECTI